MKNRNRLIMGSALGLATIAIAIDHTRHRLPEPVAQEQAEMMDESEESPCSMSDTESSPCGLGE